MAAFVAQVPHAPSALVLEGEAGIGKSTLWLDGVDSHRPWDPGPRVASGRAEQALAHVGLGDLLEDVLDDGTVALAAPRRRALAVAMLRDDASGAPVDHRAVALAVRDVLQQLGADQPVLIAVDDVQWLDRPRRPRSPLRCAGSPPARFSSCSPGGSAGGGRPSGWRTRSPATGPSACSWGRSASAPSTACCAIGSVPASPGRRCCASRSSPAGTPSSPWNWPQLWERTSARWIPSPCRRPSMTCSGADCRTAQPDPGGIGLRGSTRHPHRRAAPAGRRRAERPAACRRGPGDRPRQRDHPVHPSPAGIGAVPRPRRGSLASARDDRSKCRRPPGPRAPPRPVEGPAGCRRRSRAR